MKILNLLVFLFSAEKDLLARLQRQMATAPQPPVQPAQPPLPPGRGPAQPGPATPTAVPGARGPRFCRPRPTSAFTDYGGLSSPCPPDTNSRMAWQPPVCLWNRVEANVSLPQGPQGVFDSQDASLMQQGFPGYYQGQQQDGSQQPLVPPTAMRSASPSPAHLSFASNRLSGLSGRSFSAPPHTDNSQLSALHTPSGPASVRSSGNYSMTEYLAQNTSTQGPPTCTAQVYQRQSGGDVASHLQAYQQDYVMPQLLQTQLSEGTSHTSEGSSLPQVVGDSMRVADEEPTIVSVDRVTTGTTTNTTTPTTDSPTSDSGPTTATTATTTTASTTAPTNQD